MRHLIREMRRHDLTNKKKMTKTMTMTMTKTKTKTMTKTNSMKKRKTMTIAKNTLKEQSQRLVAFVTLVTFLTIENNNLKIHSDP